MSDAMGRERVAGVARRKKLRPIRREHVFKFETNPTAVKLLSLEAGIIVAIAKDCIPGSSVESHRSVNLHQTSLQTVGFPSEYH